MAKTIRLGTFNVENLFLRYRLLDKEKGNRFGKAIDKAAFLKGGGSILMLGTRIENFGPVSKSLRELTAKLILANKPDILAMQEVENMEVLKRFNQYFLKNQYPYSLVIDANDPRQIDVGLLSKFPVKGAVTHQFEPPKSPITKRTFSRDCLEVDIEVAKKKSLTVFVNHFKSKIGGGEEKRKKQAQRVLAIAKERFGTKLDGGDFAIAGDLNAHWDAPELSSLMKNPHLTNVVRDFVPDAEEHWTHYYAKGKTAEALDHILLSPSLAKKNQNASVTIERRGLGKDISYYSGDRFSNLTGKEGASDHCAIFVDLRV
jgi:endonuclease/exonuclease/phosphatase family metal-dependent hydrolase